jgi:hypothetical protein
MMFKNLYRVAINELKKLDTELEGKSEFSDVQAKKYECLMHGLKSQLTSEAMIEADGYDEEGRMDDGMSGRRMRNPDTGRYMSGRMMPNWDGYSGHFPYPPYMGGYGRY